MLPLEQKRKLTFDNIARAFEWKSKADLHRSYWMFKIIHYSFIAKVGAILTKLALNLHLPIRKILENTVYKQFCGGKSIKDCDFSIDKLMGYNVKTILDYCVEGGETRQSFVQTESQIIQTIEKAKNNPAIPFAVFKVSGICSANLLTKLSNIAPSLSAPEKEAANEARARVSHIAKTAADNAVRLLIDAEESWVQGIIDKWAYELMNIHNKESTIVYNTIQFYRKDAIFSLKDAYELASKQGYRLGIKLVRGAYMEKERSQAQKEGYPSPILNSKTATDDMFNRGLEFCFQHKESISIVCGTHNEESSYLMVSLMDKYDIKHNNPNFFFSQLYGMSDHISFNLSKEGYNVAKYLPYGPLEYVIPYLTRRAEENTSIRGQSNRELQLIKLEIKRRKRE